MTRNGAQDFLGYQGKTAVITGCATGMGAAVATDLIELGANVYALDVKEVTAPVEKYIKIDVGDKESIEKAAKQIPDEIDSLFNCAAVPGPPYGPPSSTLETTLINFIGLRHLTEILIPRIKSGGAIVIVSSSGGFNWWNRLEVIKELLSITNYEKARAWLETHQDVNDGYRFSKECLIVYTKWRAPELAKRNIRINCLNPNPTDTPMMRESFHSVLVKENRLKHAQGPIGRNATPEEMAEPLIFLNSNMARFISGQDLYVDFGRRGAIDAGFWPLPKLPSGSPTGSGPRKEGGNYPR